MQVRLHLELLSKLELQRKNISRINMKLNMCCIHREHTLLCRYGYLPFTRLIDIFVTAIHRKCICCYVIWLVSSDSWFFCTQPRIYSIKGHLMLHVFPIAASLSLSIRIGFTFRIRIPCSVFTTHFTSNWTILTICIHSKPTMVIFFSFSSCFFLCSGKCPCHLAAFFCTSSRIFPLPAVIFYS